MRKNFFRIFLLAMVLGILSSSFVVWGADVQPTWKTDTSPVTFDWYLNFSWFPNKWGVDDTSQYITKKTGVSLNLIVPAGNENEKLNTMIASNTLPDFITLGWWEEPLRKMIEGELVYPLNQLADKYDAYFYKVAVPARLGWYRQPDGNVYGYPNASFAPEDFKKFKVKSNMTFNVREDIWEAIGKPNMRTPDGFLKALQAAKKKFPTVNGQPLIPIGFHEFNPTGNDSFQKYLESFLAIPMEKNGQFHDGALGLNDPEYIRWLKTFRKANELGLIAKDVFIDKRAQMEEKIAQGRYFCMLYQRTDFAQQNLNLYARDPKVCYQAIDGPANSKLDPPQLEGPGISGWTVTLISKNCKNPDRAIRFMSYWMSEEGQRDFYFGRLGFTSEMVDGKQQFIPEALKVKNTDRAAFDKKYGADQTFWMLMDNPMFEQWAPPLPAPNLQMEQWTIGKAVSKAAYGDIIPPPDTPEGLAHKKISELWGVTLPKLILAKSDAEFDKIWKDFQDKKMKFGYEIVQKWQQNKVNEHKKKLGM